MKTVVELSGDISERVMCKFNLNKAGFAGILITVLLALLWGGSGRAETEKPVNIAGIYSLTGIAAESNRSSVLGVRLAVEEINGRGGVLNRPLNLILIDNMSSPIGSSLAASQASKANVAGIIGAQWSSHSLAIAQVAQENQIPMISNFSTHPELTSRGNYIFRVCFTDKFQGRIMADFARTYLKSETALIFVDLTSDYSLELSRIFGQHFQSLGGRVLSEVEYKAKEENFDRLIEQAKTHRADVVFLSGHAESGAIAYKLQQAGIDSIFLGGDGWGDRAFLKMGGNKLKRGYFLTHWSEGSEREQSRNFRARYSHLKDFGTGAALAYDAVMILVEAMETSGTVSPEKLAQQLSSLPPYEGITGSIKFNHIGDPLKGGVIMEVVNGNVRYLKSFQP